jgi:carbonic anhydrase/acetyltransferase-like protein (isoleucine patch superfamily)
LVIYEFEGKVPTIGKDTWVFDDAMVMGDVTLGDAVYVGSGARLRGDYGTITVGDRTAIEDNAIVHARPGERTEIGEHVTIGHGAILHNCTVRDGAVIGMGAIVSDYAVVEEWGVVAEGAVVKNNGSVPARHIAVGVPAKVIGEINEEYEATWTRFKDIYVSLASERYPRGLRPTER